METTYFCRTIVARKGNVCDCLADLTPQLIGEETDRALLVRLVWFADVTDNVSFRAVANSIAGWLDERFPENPPVWSLVAQRPLGGKSSVGALAVEAHYRKILSRQTVRYARLGEIPYIVLGDDPARELFFSVGPHNTWLPDCVPAQAELVFEYAARIMRKEGFPVDSIQRQWNYVEGITRTTHGCQHYQALNDARSEFYASGSWQGGYPAATGIGVAAGGITVDLNAAVGAVSHAVDNPLQYAAHVYSERVLRPGERAVPSTPKFERARVVESDGSLVCYISGTAAIRREESLGEMDAVRQTVVTVENIAQLTNQVDPLCQVRSARVYVKRVEDMASVEKVARTAYPEADLFFVQADVCRPELLVEIEALATL